MELQRLTRLGRVTRDLSAATDLSAAIDLDAVTDIIIRLVGDAVSATVTMLALRDGDELVTLGLRGRPLLPELAEGRFPLSKRVPICEAVLTGAAVLLLDPDQIADAYPHLAGGETVAMLCFLLRRGDGPEDLDAGLDRLTAVVRQLGRRGPRAPADVPRAGRPAGASTGPSRHDDDVAMLAVRRVE
jgi:hypothetical protein